MSIVNIGCSAVPGCYQAQMVKHYTELATHNPAVIGLTLLTYLGETTSLSGWMAEFNAIAIYDAQHRWRCQEAIAPVLMDLQQAEEPSAVWQSGKYIPMVVCEPAIESPIAHSFNGMQQSYGDHFTGPHTG